MKEEEKCEICKKRVIVDRKGNGSVYLYEYEMYFCRKHYKEVCQVLKEQEEKYPMIKPFGKKTCCPNWSFYCKVQEWIVLEYLFNKKDWVGAENKRITEKAIKMFFSRRKELLKAIGEEK